MIVINLAGIKIAIDNKYSFVEKQCQDYLCDDTPEFMVSVTDEELLEERKKTEREYSAGYYESICLYRKICKQMPKYKGFYLHAAVVAVDNEGYAFSAKSGTGKSTHIALWKEHFGKRAEIVNGDKPLIRLIDDQFYIYGTPWCGKEKEGSNTFVPLKALCFLEQGRTNRISRKNSKIILRRIMSQIVFPDQNEEMNLLFGLLDQLIQSIPCYTMACDISKQAVITAYEGMNCH